MESGRTDLLVCEATREKEALLPQFNYQTVVDLAGNSFDFLKARRTFFIILLLRDFADCIFSALGGSDRECNSTACIADPVFKAKLCVICRHIIDRNRAS